MSTNTDDTDAMIATLLRNHANRQQQTAQLLAAFNTNGPSVETKFNPITHSHPNTTTTTTTTTLHNTSTTIGLTSISSNKNKTSEPHQSSTVFAVRENLSPAANSGYDTDHSERRVNYISSTKDHFNDSIITPQPHHYKHSNEIQHQSVSDIKTSTISPSSSRIPAPRNISIQMDSSNHSQPDYSRQSKALEISQEFSFLRKPLAEIALQLTRSKYALSEVFMSLSTAESNLPGILETSKCGIVNQFQLINRMLAEKEAELLQKLDISFQSKQRELIDQQTRIQKSLNELQHVLDTANKDLDETSTIEHKATFIAQNWVNDIQNILEKKLQEANILTQQAQICHKNALHPKLGFEIGWDWLFDQIRSIDLLPNDTQTITTSKMSRWSSNSPSIQPNNNNNNNNINRQSRPTTRSFSPQVNPTTITTQGNRRSNSQQPTPQITLHHRSSSQAGSEDGDERKRYGNSSVAKSPRLTSSSKSGPGPGAYDHSSSYHTSFTAPKKRK